MDQDHYRDFWKPTPIDGQLEQPRLLAHNCQSLAHSYYFILCFLEHGDDSALCLAKAPVTDCRTPLLVFYATSNAGKLREFQLAAMQHNLRSRVRILALPNLEEIAPCEETGKTIEENAILKGEYYSAKAPGLLVAEDSGLEVFALGGGPGVYSARFGGAGANDDLNNQILLEQLRGVEDRSARFVCVIALAQKGTVLRTVRGTVEGYVLEHPRGTNGFGYDPVFFCPPLGCSFGELSPETKLKVSHRGRALTALMTLLADPNSGILASYGR